MRRVVTRIESSRLARPIDPEVNVLTPSLWASADGGRRLVVLSEESPKKRKIIDEIRGDYDHQAELAKLAR